MKNYPARVREWLKANPGAHTPQLILDGMGIEAGAKARRPYYSAMKDNTDAGYLERTGRGRRTAYAFVGEPPGRNTGPSESRVEKHRAYMRQRHINKGGRTLAERREDEALRKALRLDRLAAQKAERATLRERRKALRSHARLAPKPRPKVSPAGYTVIATRLAATKPEPAPPPRPRAQTVDEFIRTGGRVIRLPGIEQHIPDRSNA
ncbi:hypothetical protein [Xanthomonas maliensis]|uniref:hypothetical protein n=1 Tax=Xanthomonas maliensis TaxID=1321368 RepID=UPI0003A98D4A|nr:hypothetical protein [Xanthomonas maliensis]KAB7769336.1 hypothetical protein CKY51_07045 [Xanthomonas maliensis]